jgi:hypothetical protein
LLLDARGAVWYVDPEQVACYPVSAGPVASVSELVGVGVNGVGIDVAETVSALRPLLSSAFVLHHRPDRSAQAHSRLLYIFQKTALAQHLRSAASATVERCALQRSALWLPVRWAEIASEEAGTDVGSPDPVHAFSDADVAVRSPPVPPQFYSAVSLSLPPLPTHAHSLTVDRRGACVLLSRSTLDLSDVTVEASSAALPVAQYVSVLAEAVVAAVVNEAAEGGFALAVEGQRLIPQAAVRALTTSLAGEWVRQLQASPSGAGQLTAHLELLMHGWAETTVFSSKHGQYARLTQFLAGCDAPLLCELLSRLGRKLEPNVSHRLFPVTVAPEGPQLGVISLYEACRAAGHVHHAARLLSLACDAIGGTGTHISTAASLFLALDFLSASCAASSLRTFSECLSFCVRLERTLLEHSTSIFGPAAEASLLDESYRRTVKSRALALIAARSDSRREGPPPAASTVPRVQSSDATLVDASTPALPFYLGMGVGWVLTKAAQSFMPVPRPPSAPPIASPGLTSPGPQPASTTPRSRQLPPLRIPGPNEVGADAPPTATAAVESLQSMLLAAGGSVVPSSSVVSAVEARTGADLLNTLLTPATAPLTGAPAYSVTVLSLVLLFEERFRNSSHYCDAAVLMLALKQDKAVFAVVRDYMVSGSPLLGPLPASSTTARERVRRVLFAFGLSKAASRGLDVPSLLGSAVHPQFLRRMVDHEASHFALQSPSQGPLSCRTGRSGSWSVGGSLYGLGPFTPQQPLPRKAPQLHPDYFELPTSDNVPSTAAGGDSQSAARCLTLLSLLKALALSLLFVRDSATAEHLLTALSPYLRQSDPALHSALEALPVPVPAAAPEVGEPQQQDQEQWALSVAQLRALVEALCAGTVHTE